MLNDEYCGVSDGSEALPDDSVDETGFEEIGCNLQSADDVEDSGSEHLTPPRFLRIASGEEKTEGEAAHLSHCEFCRRWLNKWEKTCA